MGKVKALQASTGTSAGTVTGIDGTATAKSADYTVTDTDNIRTILMTTGAANKTVTLPTAADNTNRVLTIKKVDSAAGAIVVDGEGSETIEGSTTKVVATQYSAITIQCDGSAWYIIDATKDVEYAYNTGTWDASDTTSFSSGPSGRVMGGALTAIRDKRVRFSSSILNTDRVVIEISMNQTIWLPASSFQDSSGNPIINSYNSTGSGSSSAGIFLMPVTASSTDVDVRFFRYASLANDDAPTVDWQNTWYWRAAKYSS